MTLKTLIESDISSVFMNTDDFADVAIVSRDSTTVDLTVIVDSQEVMGRIQRNVSISKSYQTLMTQTSLYNFGNGATEPLTIDEFLINGRRFEARQPEGKQQCWEYTDETSNLMKIYVEEVAT